MISQSTGEEKYLQVGLISTAADDCGDVERFAEFLRIQSFLQWIKQKSNFSPNVANDDLVFFKELFLLCK